MKDDNPNKTNVTNVMRLLDRNKITYSSHTYTPDPAMSGEDIAVLLNEEPFHVFKTLVTQGRQAIFMSLSFLLIKSLTSRKPLRLLEKNQ